MEGRKQDLSDFEKGQIHALRFIANFRIREISESLDKSENTIKKYLQRSSLEGSGDQGGSRSNCGRRRCTTAEEDDALVEACKQAPFSSPSDLKASCSLQCSNSTVTYRLKEAGRHQCVQASYEDRATGSPSISSTNLGKRTNSS